MTTKIFVGNLHVESTKDNEAELRALFEQFGTVKECDILTGKNFGFVHMDNEEEAKIAIVALNGHEFMGSTINVEISTSKGPKEGGGGGDRRGGGRGGGFRGGRGGGGRGGGRGGGDRFGDRRGGGRGRGRGSDRYDPYSRGGDRGMRGDYGDPYTDRLASALRDPYTRDAYAAIAERLLRDPYSLPSRRSDDSYGRSSSDYYGGDKGGRGGSGGANPYRERAAALFDSLDTMGSSSRGGANSRSMALGGGGGSYGSGSAGSYSNGASGYSGAAGGSAGYGADAYGGGYGGGYSESGI